jgi:transposase
LSSEDLQQYLLLIQQKKIELEEVRYDYANGTTAVIAQGYEQLHFCEFSEAGKEATWQERRLIVYSIAHGDAQKKALQARIDQTQADLESLNQLRRGKKPFQDLESFVKGAERIISKNRVQSLFQLRFQEQIEHPPQR